MRLLFTCLFSLASLILFSQNHCLHFDGINDYVLFSNTTLQGDATISFWFKPDATSNGENDDRIFAVGPNPRLEIGVADSDCADAYVWIYDETSSSQLCYEANLRDGEWHHLAMVLDGVDRYVYLDGELAGTWMGPDNPLYLDNIRLGRWTGGGNSTNYVGMLDEVRIWDYSRTIEEMNQDRNCILQGDETGLANYYNFDQGIAGGNNEMLENLLDATSDENDGALLGFALTGMSSNFILSEAPIMDCTSVSVNEISNLDLTISPNPTNDKSLISTNFQGRSIVNVYSIQGQLIERKSFAKSIELNFSQLAASVYILEIVNESGRVVKKMFKQ